MTKEQKLEAIYEAMADKTLNFGCLIKTKDGAYETIDEVTIYTQGNYIEQYCLGDERTRRLDICLIIGHPVRIGCVLEFLNTTDGWHLRDELFSKWSKFRLPIDEQEEECIDFVYSLII